MPILPHHHHLLPSSSCPLCFKLPPIDEIQTNPEVRQEFIAYSAYDAQATWLVHQALTRKLKEMPWKDDLSMLDFYEMYYIPFGELLTDMER